MALSLAKNPKNISSVAFVLLLASNVVFSPRPTNRLAGTGKQQHNLTRVQPLDENPSKPARREAEATFMTEGKKTIVASTLLAFVPAMVAIALGIAQIIPYRKPYRAGSTKPEYSSYQRAFLAHRSIAFADDAELALRGAFFGMLAAMPFYVPYLFFLVEAGRYSAFVIVMFVFTLYKTVGETVNFAWVGMGGTFLATLNVWIMNGFYPGGVTSQDSDAFRMGAIDTIAFVVTILTLNLELGTKLFALSWHIYFMMSFLDPKRTSGWSVGFEIDVHGPAISALLQSGVGTGLAIIAVLLPFPIFALDKARAMSVKLTNNVAEAYTACIDCYCGDSKKPIVEDKVRRCIKDFQSTALQLNGYLASSWWECLGIGRAENVRTFLSQLDSAIRASFDRVAALNHILCKEEYGPKHIAVMSVMRPSLEVLVKEAGRMLMMVTESALDACIDDDEMSSLEAQKAKTIEALEAVTKAFNEKVVGKGSIDMDRVDEHAFCMICCSFARIGIDFVDTFKAIEGTSRQMLNLKKEIAIDVFGAFRVPIFSDQVYRNMVLRNSLSLLLAFFVGYHGYSDILKKHNPGPPTTVALLISTGLGSTAIKNLNRLQGVVLGTLFGQLAYALLAWCTFWGHIYVAGFVFLWLLLTLFVYYNGTQFSSVACLLAVFGAQGILRQCSDEVYHPASLTRKLMNTVIGVTLMTLVDQIFTLKAPSRHAKEALVNAWQAYTSAMHDIFSSDVPNVRHQCGTVFGLIDAASSASLLADAEPRIWKTPFQTQLFYDVIQLCHELRCSITCLECTGAAPGKDNSPKATFLIQLYTLKSFLVTAQDFQQYMRNVEEILSIFEHETEEDFHDVAQIKPDDGRCPLDLAKEHMESMVRELDDRLAQDEGNLLTASLRQKDMKDYASEYPNLEDNVSCKVSLVVFSLNWQFDILYNLKHRILSC